MHIVQVLITGLIAGLTAFLPLSSAGAAVVASRVLGFQIDHRLYMMILLGIFLSALSFSFFDVVRLISSLVGIFRDLFSNLKIFFNTRHGKRAYGYRRILNGNYRSLLLMLCVAMIPCMLIGAVIRPIVRVSFENILVVAAGFFVTALVLMVSSYMSGADKTPKKMKVTDGLIIGLFDGFSFIAGISRTAATASACYLSGVSMKAVRKFSILMVMILSGLMMLHGPWSPQFANQVPSGPLPCVVALLASFAGGYLMIRRSGKFLKKNNSRRVAVWNAAAGIFSIVIYLVF
ncbi:MAG: undecaprenyl-diphosphate phosphatase [Bilifractor sp.]|jgi:undecaprenyl-diphosphatase